MKPVVHLIVMKAVAIVIPAPTVAEVPDSVVVPAPNQIALARQLVQSFILVKAEVVVGNMMGKTLFMAIIVRLTFSLVSNILVMTVLCPSA